MKKFILAITLLLGVVGYSWAGGLNVTLFPGPEYIYYPYFCLPFSFGVPVGLKPDAKGFLYLENELVAETDAYIYPSDKVWLEFDVNIVPQKGKTYEVVLEAGTIYSLDDPSLDNEEIRFVMQIPEFIPPTGCEIKDGSPVASMKELYFRWTDTTVPGDNPYVTLWRNNVPIRNYPLECGGDWNLGQGYIILHPNESDDPDDPDWDVLEFPVLFEKGVEYKFVMPENAAKLYKNRNLWNKEASFWCVGDNSSNNHSIEYTGCSLYNDSFSGDMGVVEFVFDEPVMLTLDAKVELGYNKIGFWYKERTVVPSLRKSGNKYILSADFSGIPLHDTWAYYVTLPESTVVSASGDLWVNPRSVVTVSRCPAEVSSATIDSRPQSYVEFNDHDVTVFSQQESPLSIFTLDGLEVFEGMSTANGKVTIPLAKGTYIVKIGNNSVKILI